MAEGGQDFKLSMDLYASQHTRLATLVPNGPASTVVKLGETINDCYECTKLKVCFIHSYKKTEICVAPDMPIPLTTPMLAITAGQTATIDLVLSPPLDPTCSARVIIINGSGSAQTFKAVGSNVKVPGFAMDAITAYEFNWNPDDQLWYPIPILT